MKTSTRKKRLIVGVGVGLGGRIFVLGLILFIQIWILGDTICPISLDSNKNQTQPLRVFISATTPFLPIIVNWLIYYVRICGDTSLLYILCLDKQLQSQLSPYGLSCATTYPLPSGRGSHNRLWIIRSQLTYDLLLNNTDVLLCDLDAVWLKNPFPTLSLHYPSSDIVGSRAKFPEDIAQRFGATLCMGFVFIKSNNGTIAVWKALIDKINRSKHADDQRAINEIFMHHNIEFQERLKYYQGFTTESGQFLFQRKYPLNVTFLPQHEFRRHCDVRYPEAVHNTTIAHCITNQRTDKRKKLAFHYYKLWLLSNHLKEIVRLPNQTLQSFYESLVHS